MSLTHVERWNCGKWEPISAEEAAEIYPSTVHARGMVFWCSICETFVTFTDEGKNNRHFRHLQKFKERNEDCPDRSKNQQSSNNNSALANCYNKKEYYLPIKIEIEKNGFELFIGFPKLQFSDSNSKNSDLKRKITIKGLVGDECVETSQYLVSRLFSDSLSDRYLSVKNIPCTEYEISLEPSDNDLRLPSKIEGIKEGIAIFEKTGISKGIMIQKDSYIETDTVYYMLINRSIDKLFDEVFAQMQKMDCAVINDRRYQYIIDDQTRKDVINKEVIRYSFLNNILIKINDKRLKGYWLYEFKIDKNVEDKKLEAVANFFMFIHYKLDDNAVLLESIWPSTICEGGIIKQKLENGYFYTNTQCKIEAFPKTISMYKTCSFNNDKICVYCCNTKSLSRNQIVAAGRFHFLKYMYLWQDDLSMEGTSPICTVKTIDDEVVIQSGENNRLPKKKALTVSIDVKGHKVDGFYEIRRNGVIRARGVIKPDKRNDIEEIDFGDCVQIYAGLDKIWECSFVRKHSEKYIDDEALYQKLIRCRGAIVDIPHALGALADKLKDYPKTRQWLRHCVQDGKMKKQALLMLQNNTHGGV